MITRRSSIAIAALWLALLVVPHASLAAEHLTQTIRETTEAIQEGRSGYSASLVEHATNALDHAKAAQRVKANPHVETGIRHLQKAIRTARGTHGGPGAAVAVRHAEAALTQFQAAR